MPIDTAISNLASALSRHPHHQKQTITGLTVLSKLGAAYQVYCVSPIVYLGIIVQLLFCTYNQLVVHFRSFALCYREAWGYVLCFKKVTDAIFSTHFSLPKWNQACKRICVSHSNSARCRRPIDPLSENGPDWHEINSTCRITTLSVRAHHNAIADFKSCAEWAKLLACNDASAACTSCLAHWLSAQHTILIEY